MNAFELSFLSVVLVCLVQTGQACNTVNDTVATPPTGSVSTPKPPPAVVSNCGHNKYYHATNNPGIGIVGGMDARANEFPWMVRLTIASSTGSGLCGASIINNKWLITVAHCVQGVQPSDIVAIIADHGQAQVDPGAYTMAVDFVLIHEWYVDSANDYDFALLRLADYLSFSDWNTQSICLPTSCSDGCAEGTYAYIAGWGYVTEEGGNPNFLQVGLVNIWNHDACNTAYADVGGITPTHICAGVPDGSVDSCSGDSGGPMMVVEDGYFKLCGITSWGEGCARAGYPGVYSKVCTVLNWIHTNTGLPIHAST